MLQLKRWTALIIPFIFFSCQQKHAPFFSADSPELKYEGRVDFSNPKEPILITSAAFVEIGFTGDSCKVFLKKLNPEGEHNYVSIEMDGNYIERLRLDNSEIKSFTINVPPGKENHVVRIYKATEAQNNDVAFGGIECSSLTKLPDSRTLKFEFIGNSITCGMGNDFADIPCDSGEWYDKHNAYWAYGSMVARELKVQYMLSAVSGIGMYRNWNSLSPVMPDVYENLHLNTDSTQPWNFSSYVPDLVSICLGTNDMSLGDGVNDRLPFDSATYVTHYINFVNTIYSKYPDTQVCLLNSPMVSSDMLGLLNNCLKAVQSHFNENGTEKKPIAVFEFSDVTPHGCDYHPDTEDHKLMAQQLIPFYKEVLK